ncbi:MAG: nicotinate-nicotinamide nucleotide adenylyltransferase [Terriglobales bacterium]
MPSGRIAKVGMLGGTFDPIHNGHLAMARVAAKMCGLQRIYFVPAARPWHRQHPPVAGYADRYAMVALALLTHPRWLPLAIPEQGNRPTYTLDQTAWMRAHGLGERITLILGADSFATLPTWYRWRKLLTSCDWLILSRGRERWDALRTLIPSACVEQELPEGLRLTGGGHLRWVGNFAQPASASRTRFALGLGEGVPVPAQVVRFAQRGGLYPFHA